MIFGVLVDLVFILFLLDNFYCINKRDFFVYYYRLFRLNNCIFILVKLVMLVRFVGNFLFLCLYWVRL